MDKQEGLKWLKDFITRYSGQDNRGTRFPIMHDVSRNTDMKSLCFTKEEALKHGDSYVFHTATGGFNGEIAELLRAIAAATETEIKEW